MSKKYHVQRREFLNIHPTWRAYIIATVEDTSETASCCEEHRSGSEVFFELASDKQLSSMRVRLPLCIDPPTERPGRLTSETAGRASDVGFGMWDVGCGI